MQLFFGFFFFFFFFKASKGIINRAKQGSAKVPTNAPKGKDKKKKKQKTTPSPKRDCIKNAMQQQQRKFVFKGNQNII